MPRAFTSEEKKVGCSVSLGKSVALSNNLRKLNYLQAKELDGLLSREYQSLFCLVISGSLAMFERRWRDLRVARQVTSFHGALSGSLHGNGKSSRSRTIWYPRIQAASHIAVAGMSSFLRTTKGSHPEHSLRQIHSVYLLHP